MRTTELSGISILLYFLKDFVTAFSSDAGMTEEEEAEAAAEAPTEPTTPVCTCVNYWERGKKLYSRKEG